MAKTRTDVRAERGGALIRAILEKCQIDNLDIKDVVTRHFDMTLIYFDALKAGRRPVYRLDESKLERIAAWLGISKGQAYIMAGVLEPQDFYPYDDLNDKLNRVFREISNDPVWMGLTPSVEEWEAASLKMRLMMVHLYEQLSCRELLERAKTQLTL